MGKHSKLSILAMLMVPSEKNHSFCCWNVENSTIQPIFALYYALCYALNDKNVFAFVRPCLLYMQFLNDYFTNIFFFFDNYSHIMFNVLQYFICPFFENNKNIYFSELEIFLQNFILLRCIYVYVSIRGKVSSEKQTQ